MPYQPAFAEGGRWSWQWAVVQIRVAAGFIGVWSLPLKGPVLPWILHPRSFFYLLQTTCGSPRICVFSVHAPTNAHRGSFLLWALQSFLLEQGPPLCEECVSDAVPHTGRSIDTHVWMGRGSTRRCQSACRSPSKDHSFRFCIPPAGQRSSDAPKHQKYPQKGTKGCFPISVF